MLKRISIPLTALVLAGFAGTALAFIPPSAPSASHGLENAAVALHDYLHDFYPSSYGAHGLETAATTMHDDLHEWSEGNVPESQIAADMGALKSAYKGFNISIHQAEVLGVGDDTLDGLFDDVRKAYKNLRGLLKHVEG